MILILPTYDLLQQYQDSEKMFYFYNDGLKGVIRDIVLFSDTLGTPTHRRRDSFTENSDVIEKLVREFSFTPEATVSRFSDNFNRELLVEINALAIAASIGEMLDSILKKAVYEVSKTKYRWIGDDLLIEVRIFE